MSGIKDQAEIEAMRRRLYERGNDIRPAPRHELREEEGYQPSLRQEETIKQTQTTKLDPRLDTLTEPELVVADTVNDDATRKKAAKRYSYRIIILLSSLAVFTIVVVLAALYMLTGNNQISSNNIGIAISGPSSVGGGEIIPLQATVTNQNRVPIESAILIVRFPSGTKAADGSGRNIQEERITLERLMAGESINIPVRAIIFGEENQERTISAEVEYRLVDSNGTFFKKAEPFDFTIHSSPLVIRVEHLEKVSAGQEIEMLVSIQSNASTPMQNLLVTANYPTNFDYSSANPVPAFRQNVWLIGEIKPEQTIPLSIKGMVRGNQDEEFQVQFEVGTARQDNQYTVGSLLSSTAANFIIEKPFINITSTVNGISGPLVTTTAGNNTVINIDVQNTLTETLFDMAVEVSIAGNVLSREDVNVGNGFYDSIKDVIRFEVSGNPSLAEVSPGSTHRFTFSINPNQVRNTPNFEMTANALARRVSENRVIEQLIGSVKTEVRYTSSVGTLSDVRHVSGPVPPVADETTIYEINMSATSGGNDITGVVLSSSLPQYVDWVSEGTGTGALTFNPVSKEITWNVGDMSKETRELRSFRVAFTPSQAQIGTTPALLGATRLRATDRFTGVVVRAEDSPKSTQLSAEAGFGGESGRVQRAVVESDNNE